MRLIAIVVTAAGLGLAGFGAFKTSEYIAVTKAREQAAIRRIVPTVEVFVAKKPLPFGHVLKPEDVVAVAWPKSAVPDAAFQDPAVLFPADARGNRTVIRQMEKFEPLLASKVTAPGEDAGLKLPMGMRAFSFKVDSSSIAGLLRAGDRVDVYWTGSSAGLGPDPASGEITKLIESSVDVVAVDSSTNADSVGAARTITVAATPQQVARLAQAHATGRLAMSLVGIGDTSSVEVVDVDKRRLLGIEMEQAAPVETAKVCSIKTRKGADVVEIPIPCTN